VPLFIEELTKNVLESGIVTDAGDSYAAAGPVTPLAIPTSLHASLLARLDRLTPTREIAQMGAALGRSFSHELISAIAHMPQPQLDAGLAQLVDAELIYRRGTPPDAEYTFKHALVQDAAYGTLLRSRRQQLHARIAETLEKQFSEIAAAEPSLMAHHCAEAGLAEEAVRYWLKAGQQAVARSAMAEAVAQLQKGLDLVAVMPDGPSRLQLELDLRITLGPALTASRGYADPRVGETYVRARAIAEQLNLPDYLLPVLYGQWLFHNNRAEIVLVRSIAEQLEKVGQQSRNPEMLFVGHFLHGIARYEHGDLDAARALLERALNLIVSDYAKFAALDVHAVLLAYLGVILNLLGYIDQSRLRIGEALRAARRSNHAPSLVFVSNMAFRVAWVAASPREGLQHAEEVVTLSKEHGFPHFLGHGTANWGWSLCALGQVKDGLALLTKGLSVIRATGTVLSVPFLLSLLADAHMRLGLPMEGLSCVAEAAQLIEVTGERREEAHLHRLRGDLLDATGDHMGGEQSYERALAISRRQGAKVFELRAATSLARLWRDQGKRNEARELLAPVYGWFTEGFDTRDLTEAKALLQELSP
jgi:predicted ATPase